MNWWDIQHQAVYQWMYLYIYMCNRYAINVLHGEAATCTCESEHLKHLKMSSSQLTQNIHESPCSYQRSRVPSYMCCNSKQGNIWHQTYLRTPPILIFPSVASLFASALKLVAQGGPPYQHSTEAPVPDSPEPVKNPKRLKGWSHTILIWQRRCNLTRWSHRNS